MSSATAILRNASDRSPYATVYSDQRLRLGPPYPPAWALGRADILWSVQGHLLGPAAAPRGVSQDDWTRERYGGGDLDAPLEQLRPDAYAAAAAADGTDSADVRAALDARTWMRAALRKRARTEISDELLPRGVAAPAHTGAVVLHGTRVATPGAVATARAFLAASPELLGYDVDTSLWSLLATGLPPEAAFYTKTWDAAVVRRELEAVGVRALHVLPRRAPVPADVRTVVVLDGHWWGLDEAPRLPPGGRLIWAEDVDHGRGVAARGQVPASWGGGRSRYVKRGAIDDPELRAAFAVVPLDPSAPRTWSSVSRSVDARELQNWRRGRPVATSPFILLTRAEAALMDSLEPGALFVGPDPPCAVPVRAVNMVTRALRSNDASLLGWYGSMTVTVAATPPVSDWLPIRGLAATDRITAPLEFVVLLDPAHFSLESWRYWTSVPRRVVFCVGEARRPDAVVPVPRHLIHYLD